MSEYHLLHVYISKHSTGWAFPEYAILIKLKNGISTCNLSIVCQTQLQHA